MTLLRNIDQILGLCNETRLIIIKIGKYMLERKVVSEVILERKYLYLGYLLHLQTLEFLSHTLRQFWLALSFLRTINKSEG